MSASKPHVLGTGDTEGEAGLGLDTGGRNSGSGSSRLGGAAAAEGIDDMRRGWTRFFVLFLATSL